MRSEHPGAHLYATASGTWAVQSKATHTGAHRNYDPDFDSDPGVDGDAVVRLDLNRAGTR